MKNQSNNQLSSCGCSECEGYRQMDERYRSEGKTALEKVNRQWWDAHKMRDHLPQPVRPAVEWNNGIIWVEVQ